MLWTRLKNTFEKYWRPLCFDKNVSHEERVPWRYVHPQTDHVTFRTTPYVHPTFCPLWQFSTATLRPSDIFLLWHSDSVTIFYCDTSTMWHFSTVTFRLWDNFLLWHFEHVTFFYCDILTLLQFSSVTFRPPQKVDVLSHCDIPTHCNFGQPMGVTFCPLRISISPINTLSKLPSILTDDNLVTLSL